MGLKWTFKDSGTPTYMVDKRLCFGAQNSPGIFHQLTQAVRRMMQPWGYNVVCLLDDILVIDQDYNKCNIGYVTFIEFLRKLGFAIAWKKSVTLLRWLYTLAYAWMHKHDN